MEVGIILGAVAILIVWYFVAKEFRRIATMKGHDEARYFWWTFLLAIVGILMVIALPQDKVSMEEKHLRKEEEERLRKEKEERLRKEEEERLRKEEEERRRREEEERRRREEERLCKEKVVIPIETGKESIQCPLCGSRQRAGRKVCWQCGVPFKQEAE